MLDALGVLLPLRAVVVTLRFLKPSTCGLFHQPALTAFLRGLVADSDQYTNYLTIDAPECGRTYYRAGDHYRFTVFATRGGEPLLDRLLERLGRLPSTAPRTGTALMFSDNVVLVETRDLFMDAAITCAESCTEYTARDLAEEAAMWRRVPSCHMHWLSPVRVLRDKQSRGQARGDARYCRDARELDFNLLMQRNLDGLADLLRRRGHDTSVLEAARGDYPDVLMDLFWLDCEYHDAEGVANRMGGLAGRVTIAPPLVLPPARWFALVLGQYLGMGQRRVFGWGRYRLESDEQEHTLPRTEPARPLLDYACESDNLHAAWRHIVGNRARADEDLDDTPDEERLARLARTLADPDFEPPALSVCSIPKSDGAPRELLISPFLDRVAQRAVSQLLSPGLEPLMYSGSFGFRRGRSRQQARRAIEQAYADGFTWVYESDIDDFFDAVDWTKLYQRLRALYGDDPVVDRIMRWMSAPIRYEAEILQRRAGLPQGSPLSPLMANLILDDFDEDMENAGFRLIRYADDFLVLCRTPDEAERAARAVDGSIEQLGLRLNQDKTRITSFAQGFKYLGYLFVNGLVLDGSGETKTVEPRRDTWLGQLARKSPMPLDPANLPERAHATDVSRAEPGTNPRSVVVHDDDARDIGTLLLVAGEHSTVSVRANRLRVSRNGEELQSLAVNDIQALVLFGAHQITTPALRMAMRRDIPVHFAGRGGRYEGVAWRGRPNRGYDLWLLQQQRFADPDSALRAAREVVVTRLRHCKEVLRRRAVNNDFGPAMEKLDRMLEKARGASDLHELNGHEGYGTRLYFEALAKCVPEWAGFVGRNRRPPRDPFNALLSLGYSMLYAYTNTMLNVSGLLPGCGFYHQSHGLHAALASDLMEPFRHLVERAALTALLKRQLGSDDFTMDAQAGCRLGVKARVRYLGMLGAVLYTPTTCRGEEQAYMVPEHMQRQNQRLIDWLRGRTDIFQPWTVR